MEQGFIEILQKLIAEQGKENLLNVSKGLLADYTKNEYKDESDLLLRALEAGVAKAIDATNELEICKKQQVRILRERPYFTAPELAADVVDALALVLRGDTSVTEIQSINKLLDIDPKYTPTYKERKISIIKQATDDVHKIIPIVFTDRFINDEIAMLSKSLIEIKHELDQLTNSISNAQNEASRCNAEKMKFYDEGVAAAQNIWGTIRVDTSEITSSSIYKNLGKSEGRWYDIETDARRERIEKSKLKIEYEFKKRNLEALLQKTEEQRTEEHYQQLLNGKNTASNEKEFVELVKKFREMEGYKDTEALATECEGLIFKVWYDRLVNAMKKASTEDVFKDLAKQFREMNDYENTTELANKCDNAAVKVHYNSLVRAKNNASTEEEFRDLAKQFQAMNGYENTAELASECFNQCRALKERREEQERIERERRTEQERREAQQKREYEEAEKQERVKYERKEKKRKIIGKLITVILEPITFFV
jgi:hypothetical protein